MPGTVHLGIQNASVQAVFGAHTGCHRQDIGFGGAPWSLSGWAARRVFFSHTSIVDEWHDHLSAVNEMLLSVFRLCFQALGPSNPVRVAISFNATYTPVKSVGSKLEDTVGLRECLICWCFPYVLKTVCGLHLCRKCCIFSPKHASPISGVR